VAVYQGLIGIYGQLLLFGFDEMGGGAYNQSDVLKANGGDLIESERTFGVNMGNGRLDRK